MRTAYPGSVIEFIIGTALAASAGLNAWMPLFLLGLADRLLPAMSLPAGWSWLSSDVALWIVGALLVLEIVADKIPALDSVNDIVQSILRPASGGIAFGAGTSAQTVAVDDPSLFTGSTWVPIVAGIAIALVVHVVKATARVAANTATAGLAAPVLSTAEDGASFLLAAAAIIVPVVAGILLIGFVVAVILLFRRRARRRRLRAAQPAAGLDQT